MLAARVATPPTISATRGVVASLIHPSSGAPMGVLPKKAMALRDMTRPRIDGSDRNCKMALLVAMKAMLAAPIGTRKRRATVLVGENPTATINDPKITPMRARSFWDGRLRWAVNKPPQTAPMPMAARKALYRPAPPLKVNLARRGSVTVKLKAKTPTTAMESNGFLKSGVAHT